MHRGQLESIRQPVPSAVQAFGHQVIEQSARDRLREVFCEDDGVLGLAHRLLAIPLFGGLSMTDAMLLASLCRQDTIQPSRGIVRQGQPGTGLYFIEAGMCEVRRHDGVGGTLTVGRRSAGACIGAAALITGRPEPATVMAIEPTQALWISPQTYQRLLLGVLDVEYEVRQVALFELAEVCAAAGHRPSCRAHRAAHTATTVVKR